MDTINVDEREPGLSSKDLRAARKENRIPAAIYGKGVPSQSLFLKISGGRVQELKMGKHFKVKLGSKTLQATVDEVQQDPVSHKPLHVSLHAVSSEQVMKVEVPLVITGEAKGHKQNGVVTQLKNTIALKGMFKDLPEQLELDISDLDVNEHLEVKDIQLPKGAELLEDNPSQNVVICSYSNVNMEADTEQEPVEETETSKAQAQKVAGSKSAEPEGKGAEPQA